MYSYLLFGSAPSDATRERYQEAIKAYLEITEARKLETYFVRLKLNITYLPVATLAESEAPEWLLNHYDYARARALLHIMPSLQYDGLYIISSLKPLSSVTSLSGKYLFQDLSFVPPNIVAEWVREFLGAAAKQQAWKTDSVKRLALELRTAIAILASGLPDVQNSLKSWIVAKN